MHTFVRLSALNMALLLAATTTTTTTLLTMIPSAGAVRPTKLYTPQRHNRARRHLNVVESTEMSSTSSAEAMPSSKSKGKGAGKGKGGTASVSEDVSAMTVRGKGKGKGKGKGVSYMASTDVSAAAVDDNGKKTTMTLAPSTYEPTSTMAPTDKMLTGKITAVKATMAPSMLATDVPTMAATKKDTMKPSMMTTDAPTMAATEDMATTGTPTMMTTTAATLPSDSSLPCGCELLQLTFSLDELLASLTSNAVGDTLQYPVYSVETGEQVGIYQDTSTSLGGNVEECNFLATYSFDPTSPETGGVFYENQIMVQGTCSGARNTITGGTNEYACVSGYDYFEEEAVDGMGIVNLVLCDAGCGSGGVCEAEESHDDHDGNRRL